MRSVTALTLARRRQVVLPSAVLTDGDEGGGRKTRPRVEFAHGCVRASEPGPL